MKTLNFVLEKTTSYQECRWAIRGSGKSFEQDCMIRYVKKDLVIGLGVGIPVVIIMIVIGGGGHSDFELEKEDLHESFPKTLSVPASFVDKTKDPQSYVDMYNSEPSYKKWFDDNFAEYESIYQAVGLNPDEVSEEPEPIASTSQIPPSSKFPHSSDDCLGNARCIIGKVTKVIDGDTVKVEGQSIRFALASAPELSEFGGETAREFIEEICPVGSSVLVDEDGGQTQGIYGRIIGVIYCNGANLNEELVDSGLGYLATGFCDKSEFSSHSWAQKHGCASSESHITTQQIRNDCDSSYPDFCIASPPPDLDCGDISQKRFTVLQPDPHRFDGDKDGIGCES